MAKNKKLKNPFNRNQFPMPNHLNEEFSEEEKHEMESLMDMLGIEEEDNKTRANMSF